MCKTVQKVQQVTALKETHFYRYFISIFIRQIFTRHLPCAKYALGGSYSGESAFMEEVAGNCSMGSRKRASQA